MSAGATELFEKTKVKTPVPVEEARHPILLKLTLAVGFFI